MRLPKSILARARATATPAVPKVKPNREPMSLYLPYPPSLNRLWRSVNGRTLLSREGRAYRQQVQSWAWRHNGRPLDGPVRLEVHLYRPKRTGDLDNFLKAALDAIKGIAYHDDSQVTEIHAYRSDAIFLPRGRLVIHVGPDERGGTNG